MPGGLGLNIAYEAVDRHATGPAAGRVALRCLSESGAVRELTYGELAERSSRFASARASLGSQRATVSSCSPGGSPEQGTVQAKRGRHQGRRSSGQWSGQPTAARS